MADEVHIHEHSSPIKTPKQLIIAVVAAFAVPVAIIVMLANYMTGGIKVAPEAPERVAERIKPVGTLVLGDGAPAPAAAAERTGEQIVKAVCSGCHETGKGGAPKIGDQAAWRQRVSRGVDAVTKAAIKGHGGMPARGGVADLTDSELKGAILYMFKAGGAQEAVAQAAPAAPAAPASGDKVYAAACAACHSAGIAGAPKTGDKAAWAARIATGKDALYASALKGKGAMPAKGGAANLSDAEVKAAVDYLVGQAK